MSTRERERDEHAAPRLVGTGEPSRRDIVVIGASMGGVDALGSLLGSLPNDFGASLLVVVHTRRRPVAPRGSPAILHEDARDLRRRWRAALWSTVAHREEIEVLLKEMEQTLRRAGGERGADAHRREPARLSAVTERARSVALDPLFSERTEADVG